MPGVCAWRMARHGTTSRHATYACGVGVMRLLLSSLRRDGARAHIILTFQSAEEMPGSLDYVGGPHFLEPSPRLLQFYLYKGAAHRREGSPSPYFTFYQACLYVGGAVSSLVFVLEENWMSFQHLARLSFTIDLLSSSQPGTFF